ncbi:MAG: hypothetical protein CVU21_25465 [Betaproteobacteria bacterium HGW-Betaproteobacteria-15]|nr:MAG: hypothetical protein CVU21_25465 [Betaproteobacteria bacterium HGW-Betaproteobacteria-15]
MLHRLLLTFALTFLLGFSQQSALLHEISHLADLDSQSQQQDQAPQHSTSCEHCLSISHFAHGLVSQYYFDFDQTSEQAPAANTFLQHTPAHTQTYAARAPPPLI